MATQEHIIYEHQTRRGVVLVTDQRVVFGGETWPTTAIEGVRLIPCEMVTGWMPLTNEKPYPKSYWVACAFIGTALLLAVAESRADSHPTLYLCLAGLFFVLAGGCIVYMVFTNPREVYALQLTLKTGQHKLSQYTWYEKLAAQEAMDAVEQVLTNRSGTRADDRSIT